MNIATPQKTTPTVQLCFARDTNGGRHGCRLGIGLGGPLSTAFSRVHAADVHHVSSYRHGMGLVPLAADGDESGLHDRLVVARSCRAALDGVREVLLSCGVVAAGDFPAALDACGCAADRPLRRLR